MNKPVKSAQEIKREKLAAMLKKNLQRRKTVATNPAQPQNNK